MAADKASANADALASQAPEKQPLDASWYARAVLLDFSPLRGGHNGDERRGVQDDIDDAAARANLSLEQVTRGSPDQVSQDRQRTRQASARVALSAAAQRR